MDNLLIPLQTAEVLELSKQIKEKLKEADQFGNPFIWIIVILTPFTFILKCFVPAISRFSAGYWISCLLAKHVGYIRLILI